MVASHWSRWITLAAVLLLSAIAAVVSYAHMFELALLHGEPAWRAGLFPLSVDGMIVAASMSLLSDAGQGRRWGVLPWTLLIVGSVASLAANVAVADPTVWSRVIHAWPSFALMGAYELLMRHFRGTAHGERPAYASSMSGEGSDTATVGETRSIITVEEPQRNADHWGQCHLRVVGDAPTPGPLLPGRIHAAAPTRRWSSAGRGTGRYSTSVLTGLFPRGGRSRGRSTAVSGGDVWSSNVGRQACLNTTIGLRNAVRATSLRRKARILPPWVHPRDCVVSLPGLRLPRLVTR